MDTALLVTISIFVGGLVYHAGRMANKVDSLEEWRREAGADIKAVRSTTDRLEALLNAEARR